MRFEIAPLIYFLTSDKNKPLHSYAAPENLCCNKAQSTCSKSGYDGLKADVWSLGIVLYVLLYGCTPWGSAQDDNTDFRSYRISFGCPNVKPWNTMATPFRTLFQRFVFVGEGKKKFNHCHHFFFFFFFFLPFSQSLVCALAVLKKKKKNRETNE